MSRGPKVGIWIGVVLLILMILGSVFVGANWAPELVIHLVSGWVSHSATVLPKVTVNWSGVGMMVACVALAAAFGHRFAGWLWQGTGHAEPWKIRWTMTGLGMLVLMFGAGMAFTAVAHQTGWLLRSPVPLVTGGMENRYAVSSLKSIASAQADFRGNDREDNKIQDFWCKDVAGLYALKGIDGQPLRLIDLSVAEADDRPVTDLRPYSQRRAPASGFWFRTLPRGADVPATDGFAVCAYPHEGGEGTFMFLVTETGTIYRTPFRGTPPAVCPDDPLKHDWWKLD